MITFNRTTVPSQLDFRSLSELEQTIYVFIKKSLSRAKAPYLPGTFMYSVQFRCTKRLGLFLLYLPVLIIHLVWERKCVKCLTQSENATVPVRPRNSRLDLATRYPKQYATAPRCYSYMSGSCASYIIISAALGYQCRPHTVWFFTFRQFNTNSLHFMELESVI